ncbi:hypothetical protein E5676_scaffold403G00400 [Cucumis melo var. makuwa]|uniref:Uncharacterized protein n=1 Tax=Cucumis melo var. makuwa TaxID=1194695 RepID=A0A5D3DZP9_CUCMM|nr:hypothetical protein E6C27_scaffold114G00560 [Cucumis melo var. makuwa]TYK28720.1 hypothetical protein E5676_scaffold403G00400 [Cucumis melo var. makuwa]
MVIEPMNEECVFLVQGSDILQKDNLIASARDTCGPSTYTELKFEVTKLSAMKKLLMVLVKNPYSTSGDTNDRNDCEEEGDKDGQIHEDHSVDVDGTHQADKDSVNER